MDERPCLGRGSGSRVPLPPGGRSGACWFRRSAVPQFDAQGAIQCWFGTLTDTHDAKLAEAAACEAGALPRERDVRAQLAQPPSRAGIFEWDPVTGELRWSARCKAAFGWPADEELKNEVLQSRLHLEDQPAVLARIERALDPSGRGHYRSQHRVLWPDGTVHWMRARGEATFAEVGRMRRAVLFTGTVLDVTEARDHGALEEGPTRRVGRGLSGPGKTACCSSHAR